MDKSQIHYYEQELRYLRELSTEFARRFPKVAGRLGMGEHSNSDAHLERLFQGFSFFAGRVRQRLDAEFPVLTEGLLDSIYPHFLKPTPSMAVVQFQPVPTEASLLGGATVPRGTELRARSGSAPGSVCHFTTAHDVRLWPIQVEDVQYTSVLSEIADLRVPAREPIHALLKIRLRLTAGRSFSQLPLHSLPLFIDGDDDATARLHEALIAHAGTTVLRWGDRPHQAAFGELAHSTRPFGFDDDQALFPEVPAAFRGYRLLHEYFTLPARFRSVELLGLGAGIGRCDAATLNLIVPLTRHDAALERQLGRDRIKLFVTPVINLFDRRLIVSTDHGRELRLVPDRTQPLDFEVHSVCRVAVQSAHPDQLNEHDKRTQHSANPTGLTHEDYTIERRPRLPQQVGSRTEYTGTETFLCWRKRPLAGRQLVIETRCTNRDLPLLLARDRRRSLTMSTGAPVDEVRLLAGPSAPRFEPFDGETTWQLVNHLHLNYLSLSEGAGGSAALREILALYVRMGDPLLRREVDGVRALHCRSVVGPYPEPGPRNFVRGIEVQLHCEEQAFTHGALILGTVLAHFFAKHASTHSFTQTVLHTRERGEVYRWPALAGLRPSW